MNCVRVLANGSPSTRRVNLTTAYFGCRDPPLRNAVRIGFIMTKLVGVIRWTPRVSPSSASVSSYESCPPYTWPLSVNLPRETSAQAYSSMPDALGNILICTQSCAFDGTRGPTTTMT